MNVVEMAISLPSIPAGWLKIAILGSILIFFLWERPEDERNKTALRIKHYLRLACLRLHVDPHSAIQRHGAVIQLYDRNGRHLLQAVVSQDGSAVQYEWLGKPAVTYGSKTWEEIQLLRSETYDLALNRLV